LNRSVEEMKKVLRRDIYNLVHPGTLISEVTAPLKEDPLRSVGYSCTYWIDHACEIDKSRFSNGRSQILARLKHSMTLKKHPNVYKNIATFFQDHFLQWLEALSLLNAVTNGVVSVTRLKTLQVCILD